MSKSKSKPNEKDKEKKPFSNSYKSVLILINERIDLLESRLVEEIERINLEIKVLNENIQFLEKEG